LFCRCLAVAIVVSSSFLPFAAAYAQSAEVVEMEAKAEEGFGRMILTFKDRTLLPHYDAAVTNNVLRVAFEAPIQINVDDVPLQLADYVAVARRDPDGSAIRFALKDKYRINTLEAGEKLFIDILPSNWQGLPPGLPDEVVRELARRAEEAMRQVRALEQARLKAQEGPKVTLSVGDHPTFTRLVFDWSIQFDTAFVREDDVIRVTFNHPAQLDVGDLRARLPRGVVDATAFIDEGKLKFLMRLEPGVDIRAFREEQTYVIDITPEGSREAPDPANAAINDALGVTPPAGGSGMIVAPGARDSMPRTPEGAPAPSAPEGRNPVFDGVEGGGVKRPGPGAIGPHTVPETPVAAVPEPEVAAGADLELAAVEADGAAPYALPRSKPEASVALALKPQEDGAARIIPPMTGEPETVASVAFVPPSQEAPAAAASPAETPSQPASVAAGEGEPAGDRLLEVAPVAPPSAGSSPSAPAAQTPPPADLPAVIDVSGGAARPQAAPGNGEAWRAHGGADPAASQTQPVPQSIFGGPSRSPESLPPNAAEETLNFVAAEARRIGNSVRVVFPFREQVSTALFRRNNSIWMVFDSDATIDVRGMRSALGDTATNVSIEKHGGYSVLRVDVSSATLATLGADGNAWNLVIGDMIVEPSRPLLLERTITSDGGSVLRVSFQNPRFVRKFTDPDVGDDIYAVTGFGPARGLLKPQTFVDLDVMASAQGVAVVPKSDGVSIKLVGDDVILEKTDGLVLSNSHLRQGSGSFNSIVAPNNVASIEFSNLTTSAPEDFIKRRNELEAILANAPEGRRQGPRLDLARFYLAHVFPHESLGLMELALEEEPALAQDPMFNLMMGAAQTLAGRPREAYPHLNRPDLKNNPDAAVWQTIVEVALGNWAPARIALPRGRAVIGNYPVNIQAEFNLAAAQAMVELNDFGMANTILAEIEPALITPQQATRYDLLRGRVADASGRSLEALTAFDLVARSYDRPRAAEAQYRALRIRYRDGEVGIDKAIDELAGLATSWRGDETELKTLRLLAQLQAEKGNYREAFEAMKAAIQAQPDAETTRLLQEEMSALFASLFLDGKADAIPAVKSLALFYDFRELMPVGRQGDEMVRKLAKRLVEVDLLDQAAGLLQHQVDNRLKGAARAQIAADLGAIYLMDRKPERALAVLNRTRQANLPSSLERQRNIIEARALTESGRPDLALELVRNMRGADVDRLRADTFWSAQSWRDAGEQLEAMYGSRWSDNIPLEEIERNDILKAAIAYSLAGDQLSLDRLSTKYAKKMADSPQSASFEVVTRPIAAQGVEFLDVAKSIAATDTLDTFLEEYRRQYMSPSADGGSSSLANAGPANG
jgi:tetratricopeptide (TPR) repeat protein